MSLKERVQTKMMMQDTFQLVFAIHFVDRTHLESSWASKKTQRWDRSLVMLSIVLPYLPHCSSMFVIPVGDDGHTFYSTWHSCQRSSHCPHTDAEWYWYSINWSASIQLFRFVCLIFLKHLAGHGGFSNLKPLQIQRTTCRCWPVYGLEVESLHRRSRMMLKQHLQQVHIQRCVSFGSFGPHGF